MVEKPGKVDKSFAEIISGILLVNKQSGTVPSSEQVDLLLTQILKAVASNQIDLKQLGRLLGCINECVFHYSQKQKGPWLQ